MDNVLPYFCLFVVCSMPLFASLKAAIAGIYETGKGLTRVAMSWATDRMWIVGSAMMVVSVPILIMGEVCNCKCLMPAIC